MRPPRHSRTGTRRDGRVRVIRSNMPETHVTVHGLGAVRDTGLALEGLVARQRRHRERVRRRTVGWSLALIAAVSIAAFGWWTSSERRAAAEPFTDPIATLVPGAAAHARGSTTVAADNPKAQDPTPLFAAYRSLQLRLPVAVARLTEVGFHQASYTYTLHMTTPLPDADNGEARAAHGTGRETDTQPAGADALLNGSVIRMWRSRPGKPDSAADVGALPGSDVFAPVSGTVVKIKPYKLYGEFDDYEIHIQPKGWPDIDLVMIHLTGLSITVGDEVVGGVTRLAAVRQLSDKLNDQLADYTKDGGDHVHLQLNNAKDPRYKGLEGAVEVQQ